jgi:hypothetical protein
MVSIWRTAIAKEDGDADVKEAVIHALAFRRADRHVVEVLKGADNKVFDRVVAVGLIDDVSDAVVQTKLEAARQRRKAIASNYERLQSIMISEVDQDHVPEVTAIVSEMEIDHKRDDTHLFYEMRKRYPRALAEGLLSRVREGRSLFHGADDILGSAGFALEDDKLVEIALAETRGHDVRAEAAASTLGPAAVGRMIEAYLEAKKRVSDFNGKFDQAASDRYHDLRARIEHTPGASLIAAVQARGREADNDEIAELGGLLSRQSEREDERARPFTADGLATIAELVQQWGERMLASGDAASRDQVASLATLISHVPSVALLPLLKRLLDDNLRRYRAFREEAEANGWHHGKALNEARTPHTHEYMRAFLSINAPETAALMEEYLADEHFGKLAANVLAQQWTEANEPKDDRKVGGDVQFSRVAERRAARATHPAETSAEAEAIFRVIDTLITDESTVAQRNLAVDLGIIGARQPHGQREATIDKLISLAPRQARAALLRNLILSGEEVDIELIAIGVAEVLDAAKAETWILTQHDAYQLREWLRLLPFADQPTEALPVLRRLPEAQRTPQMLEEVVGALADAPSNDAEQVLFKLAEEDPRLYANHRWRDTVLRMGTSSAARRFIDLTAEGVFNGGTIDSWHLARQIGGLTREYPELRSHICGLLKDGVTTPGLTLLAQAFAESPDTEGLLLLIRFEMEQKRPLVSWHTLEKIVTERVPSENWKGAYDVVPVPAIELRKRPWG